MILVLGESGQVAQALRRELPNAEFAGRSRMDLAVPGLVGSWIREKRPKLVINAAAYTQVDKAETETHANERLNAELLTEIGEACRDVEASVLHFSTDYVYPGVGTTAQTETDATGPLGAYGQAKLRGEQRLLATGVVCHILRISWVYSPWGANFVKTMLRLGAERTELNVVDDQCGSPMSAIAIAHLAAQTSIPRLLEADCLDREVYNLSAAPFVTWHGFAQAIFGESRRLGQALKIEKLNAIPTTAFPTPAKRPANSRMSDAKFRDRFATGLPDWRQDLQETLSLLSDMRDERRST